MHVIFLFPSVRSNAMGGSVCYTETVLLLDLMVKTINAKLQDIKVSMILDRAGNFRQSLPLHQAKPPLIILQYRSLRPAHHILRCD